MKKITIAIDKFKGSLSAGQAANAIEKGIVGRCSSSGEEPPCVVKVPLADGGDGSLDVVEAALINSGRPFRKEVVQARSLLGGSVDVPVIIMGDLAFIEMAKVCGLSQVRLDERDPVNFTTYGLGQCICAAVRGFKAKRIVVAIGGSATNDGGRGMLRAMEGLDLSTVKFEVACDVTNPLLGPCGATYVYAPQKFPPTLEQTILKERLAMLEQRMERWAQEVGGEQWREAASHPGAGAAGGIGFAFSAVLGAELKEGWKLFCELVGLESNIATSDLVITGEGKFDSQSLSGKLPWGVSQLCRKYNKPLIVACGVNEASEEMLSSAGIDKVLSLSSIEPNHEKSMANGAELLWHLFCKTEL